MKSLAEQHRAKPPYKSLQIICLCKYIIYNDLQGGLSPNGIHYPLANRPKGANRDLGDDLPGLFRWAYLTRVSQWLA